MKLRNLLHKLNRRDTRILPKFSLTAKAFTTILIIIGITFFTYQSFAAEATNILKQKQDAIAKGNNQEAWMNEAMGSNMMSMIQMMTGPIPFESDGSIKLEGYVPRGAIGSANNLVASLYRQPASGIDYIAQVKDNFLGKPAYAQGVGFQGLQPLLPLWRTLRNVVYVLFSLFFIAIGIGITLRIKVSPQAVVSIQNSIPGIITALILVTFSYAIAGLLIDISYLFLSVCLAFFFQAKGVDFGSNLFDIKITNSGINPLAWLGNAFKWVYTNLASVVGIDPFNLNNLTNASFGKIQDLTFRAIPGASSFALGELIGKIFLGCLLGGIGSVALGGFGQDVAGAVGGGVGDIVGGVLGLLLIPIIMSILIIFWLIKLYFGMIKCYITVILKIILAPFEIGFGAVPNAKLGFSSWITDIIANLSVFPITIIFLVFINYLTDLVSGDLWAPPTLDTTIIGGNASIFSAAVGIAGLAMLSKLPTLIPQVIFQIKPSEFGKAIGENLKPVSGAAKFGARGAAQYGAGVIDERMDEHATRGTTPSGRLKFLNIIKKTAQATGTIK